MYLSVIFCIVTCHFSRVLECMLRLKCCELQFWTEEYGFNFFLCMDNSSACSATIQLLIFISNFF